MSNALAFPMYYFAMEPHTICTLWHRTSRDGYTFEVRPEFMRADEAEIALTNSPHTYSIDGVRLASWPAQYSNVLTSYPQRIGE